MELQWRLYVQVGLVHSRDPRKRQAQPDRNKKRHNLPSRAAFYATQWLSILFLVKLVAENWIPLDCQVVRTPHFGLVPNLAWLISHFLVLKRSEIKHGKTHLSENGIQPFKIPQQGFFHGIYDGFKALSDYRYLDRFLIRIPRLCLVVMTPSSRVPNAIHRVFVDFPKRIIALVWPAILCSPSVGMILTS